MKLLYFTHINWFWIFQRPQKIALLLDELYDQTVVHKRVVFKPLVDKNNRLPKKIKTLWQLPKEDLFPCLKLLNRWMLKIQIRSLINQFDIVWLCHPIQFDYLPENFHGKIIYDCMDNHVALASESDKQIVFELEQKLLKRANLVFATSSTLQNTVPNLGKSILVRNGFDSSMVYPISQPIVKDKYKLSYFGTIAEWFDYESLNAVIKEIDGIFYSLIGPISHSNPEPDDDHYIFEGVVKHDELFDKIKDSDALMMPFVINDIILSVDPVKLYEYICFGKCIISVWYPEIDRFAPFVYFYKDAYGLKRLLIELKQTGFKPKYSRNEQIRFLNENSWGHRLSVISKHINSL